MNLDDGDRLDFTEETVELVLIGLGSPQESEKTKIGKIVGNWVLHELGGLLTTTASWQDMPITTSELADLILHLQRREITSRTAKQLLVTLYNETSSIRPTVEQLVEEGNLRLRPLSEEEYVKLARNIMEENPELVTQVREQEKGRRGKVMWFVGGMMRRGEEGTVEPEKARKVVEGLLLGGS